MQNSKAVDYPRNVRGLRPPFFMLKRNTRFLSTQSLLSLESGTTKPLAYLQVVWGCFLSPRPIFAHVQDGAGYRELRVVRGFSAIKTPSNRLEAGYKTSRRWVEKNLNCKYRKKATDDQYFPEVLFIMLYRPVLTFEPVDEILMCDFKGGLTQNCFFLYFHRIKSLLHFLIFGTLFSIQHLV